MQGLQISTGSYLPSMKHRNSVKITLSGKTTLICGNWPQKVMTAWCRQTTSTCTCTTTLTQRQLTNQEFHTVTDWSKEVSCPAFVLPEGVVYPPNIHTIIHLKNLLPWRQLTNSPMTTVLTTNRKKRFINTSFPWYHEFKWLRRLFNDSQTNN